VLHTVVRLEQDLGARPRYLRELAAQAMSDIAGDFRASHLKDNDAMNTQPATKAEAGGILLMSLGVVLILSLVAAIVLRSMGSDLKDVGAQKRSDEAQAIAEAGIEATFDLMTTTNPPLNPDNVTSSLIIWLDKNTAPITCEEDVMVSPTLVPSIQPCDKQFGANANTNTNPFKAVDFDPALANTDFEPAYNITGKFFVAVQRGPCPPGPSCQIVTLRSLGTNSTGNRKLIEVVVTMGNK
jgi:hypothetical protein